MKPFVYVVEGRHDAARIKAGFPQAEIVVTNGTHIPDETFVLLEKLKETHEIVLLTDPDHAGEKIRRKIAHRIEDVSHIHIEKTDAVSKNGLKIGVEHMEPTRLKSALETTGRIVPRCTGQKVDLSDMIRLGLSHTENSKEKRAHLGRVFGIGSTNTKAFMNRINMLGISAEDIESRTGGKQ